MVKVFHKLLFLFCVLLALPTISQAQRLVQFSDNKGEFMLELKELMTSGKRKALEEVYEDFANVFRGGVFNEEESKQILALGNQMLDLRMAASPYFNNYLSGLLLIKKQQNADQRFIEWQSVLDQILKDEETNRKKMFHDFLRFSIQFFENKALRTSSTGTSWFANSDDYEMIYEAGSPILKFGQLDLMAISKKDSIFIRQTKGDYFPNKKLWKGQSGKVGWDRFDFGDEVFVELNEYEIDTQKSLYEAKDAKLNYPVFFGNRKIVGDFSDKLVYNKEGGGSYPRFASKGEYLKLNNIGEGIEFVGGFKLQGQTFYGVGSEEMPARLDISNFKGEPVFSGESKLFTIKREERIIGERVMSTLYFDQDSIFHPSVNIRFEIPSKEIQLTRGKRGSDRNPFFNSYHKVNIDVERIDAFLDRDSIVIGKRSLALAKNPRVFIESLKFFKKSDYQRIQNIATSNPIAIMKVTAEREGNNFIDANLLARRINSKFTSENIQSLLYDLVSKGFINYDKNKNLVEVKDKVFHYVDAAQDNVDYDVLRILSETSSTNAHLDLKSNELFINGVSKVEFSSQQKVAVKPVDDYIVMKQNRDLDFDGRIFAGFTRLEGKDFHFDYDKFQIGLDSVRFFDIFVPTGDIDENKQPIAESISSRIEHLNGVLLIDAPSNKSGRDTIKMFPSLQSKNTSFVYYDFINGKDTISDYIRDSFYFELEPFSFDRLDAFSAKDLQFEGAFISADIFPPFDETLQLQEHDKSLGFTTDTPADGYPTYLEKGQFKGAINLSNEGLKGQGNLKYLGASVDSEDILFKPKQMLASAEIFDMAEDRASEVQVPKVHGINVNIDWRPYQDSMYIRSDEAPFSMFQQDDHSLAGTLILTPDGLKANGKLDWKKATMQSKLFSFGAFSVKADTTDLGIKAFDADQLALKTTNVNGEVDFESEVGKFKANDEFLITDLPYNQYQTSMNEFDWNMKEEKITFKSDLAKIGNFLSIHPDQDSLKFSGQDATYDLKTSELKISGVPYIVASDAFIYPDSNYVEIQPGGKMATLSNAKIIADTVNQYHVINQATVDVLGGKEYRATGFYEYNIGNKEQEIEFTDIVGTRVGKGKRSEKKSVTRASGDVSPDDNFYIDLKTRFQGKIALNAESKNLQFDGFAKLDADRLPQKFWFTVSSEGDKKDLAIRYDKPKSEQGYPLETGLYLSKETARIYPRVMMPLMFRKDRPLFPTVGVFKYDKSKDYFIFGDSLKLTTGALTGNKLIFKNKTGEVEAEGKFNLGSGLKYVSIDAAGEARTEFPLPLPEEKEKEEEESGIMLADEFEEDSTAVAPPPIIEEKPVNVELMAGIKLIIPESLLKLMVTDFKSVGFEAQNITYLTDINFYKKSALELFPNNEEVKIAVNSISSGFLDIPKKYNPYTFLFSRLKMKWDPDYQSFVTVSKKTGLNSIAGEPLHKMVTAYVECKMPTNDDDRLYVYLKSPSELYYFFGFKQGILSIVSNNPKFMEAVAALKSKDTILKMPDGETYEIQVVEPGSANMFLRRVEAANK